MRRLACAVLLLASSAVFGQRIDFARLFPSEEQQFAGFRDALARLETYRGRVAKNPDAAVEAYNAVLIAFERLDAFLYLRSSADLSDTRLRDAEETLSADFERRTAFFLREAGSVPPQRSKHYAWFFELAKQRAQHLLPPGEEELLAGLQPLTSGWQSPLHDALDARKQPAADRDLYAFTLIRLARAGNELARLRRYDDAASAAYAASQLSKADVTRLLDGVAAHADLYKRYEATRANRPPSESPRYTLDDARAILPRALAPLGATYTSELEKLLDPASGRLDLGPGDHRRRGGFSKGFPGFPSLFYTQAFRGAYNDLRIVAHESTHAMQSQLQSARGVAPVYVRGTKYLLEACAIFHELLLPEYLAEHASDPAQRRFFLEQFLDSKGIAVVFRSAAEAAIEQAVYDGVASGALRGADDLDALTTRIAASYGTPPRLHWTSIRLMYDDPFYDVNYTVAGLVALQMYARSKRDPEHFLPAYVSLLANGFTAPADELLRRFVGIDIRDPRFVADSLEAVRPKIEELERLYAAAR